MDDEKLRTVAIGAMVKHRRMGALSLYLARSSGTSLGIRVNLAKKVPLTLLSFYAIW